MTSTNKAPTIGNVRYAYDIEFAKDGTGTATIDFVFDIGGVQYPSTVTGQVNAFTLNEQYIMIAGGLYGLIAIGNRLYEVDAYLQKLANQDGISVGISLTPPDFNTNPNACQTFIGFGPTILTGDVLTAYDKYVMEQKAATEIHTSSMSKPSNSISQISPNSHSLWCNNYGYTRLPDDPTVSYEHQGEIGQRLRTYVNEERNSITVFLSSYCRNFEALDFSNVTFSSASIHAYRIGLAQHVDETFVDNTYIDMSETPMPATGSATNLLSSFMQVLNRIASYGEFGSIVEAITSTLRYVTGSVSVTKSHTQHQVHVIVSSADVLSFDNADCPMTFFIECADAPQGKYKSYSDITYRITASRVYENTYSTFSFLVRCTTITSPVITIVNDSL